MMSSKDVFVWWQGLSKAFSTQCSWQVSRCKGATISLWGGAWKIFFSGDVKAGFFFTHHFKPDFFFYKNWRSGFFLIVILGRPLFLPLCGSDRLFIFATHQSQKLFEHTSWAKLFFSAKNSARLLFSKSLPARAQIMKWSLPNNKESDVSKQALCTVAQNSHLRFGPLYLCCSYLAPRAHPSSVGTTTGAVWQLKAIKAQVMKSLCH